MENNHIPQKAFYEEQMGYQITDGIDRHLQVIILYQMFFYFLLAAGMHSSEYFSFDITHFTYIFTLLSDIHICICQFMCVAFSYTIK